MTNANASGGERDRTPQDARDAAARGSGRGKAASDFVEALRVATRFVEGDSLASMESPEERARRVRAVIDILLGKS